MNGTSIASTSPSRVANVVTWVVQVLLAVAFAGGGALKLSGDPVMVDLFADIGAGSWLRYLVGALELAGAVGLLIAPLCGLAATGLAALMVGAIITNVTVIDESPVLPAGYLVVLAVVAWRRRDRVRALGRRLSGGRS
jgi:uncharacterized membrane protein YphA (DoxX/SURF4 family)